MGVVTAAAAAAGIGARALSGWCATTSLVGRFAGGAGNTVLTGLAAANVFFNLKSAYQEFTSPNGDPIRGVLDLLLAGADAYNVAKFLANSCFTGEMLLDAEGGKNRADAIVVGDKLWSRNEFDPTGPIELKEVEDVFTRVAPIWNVHVAGQTLRTTAEHTFYVLGRGWIPAKMLAIGDVLLTRSGQLVPVEGVADSGAVETVYNWRVGEYHTYFVSETEEGDSIWAHNSNYSEVVVNGRKVTVYKNIAPGDASIVTQKPGVRLEQRNGKWVTVSNKPNGSEVVFTANGTYHYVVRNGMIDVIRPQDVSSHTTLAGVGPAEYAGTIKFGSSRGNRGQIQWWDNGSGHFIPRPVDAPQAGLPMDLFRPH